MVFRGLGFATWQDRHFNNCSETQGILKKLISERNGDMGIENLKYIFFTKEDKKDYILHRRLQSYIADKLRENEYVFCFDEVGAGKTIQGMYCIWDILVNKKPDEKCNILIIAPNKTLAIYWQNEIRRYLGISFRVLLNEGDYKRKSFDEDGSNLFITFNGSQYERLGLLNLKRCSKEFSEEFGEEILCNFWDLIILDEAHAIFDNYYKALFGETVYTGSGKKRGYYPLISYNKTDKLLVLSATPILTHMKDPFEKLASLPKKLLTSASECFEVKPFDAALLLDFSSDNPYQRYFKEVILNKAEAVSRKVSHLTYTVNDLMKSVWDRTYQHQGAHYHFCGNFFNLLNKLKEKEANVPPGRVLTADETDILNVYKKDDYSCDDIRILSSSDDKTFRFIEYLRKQIESADGVKMLIFLRSIETRKYLKKILKYLDITIFEIDAEDDAEVRIKQVSDFNECLNDNKVLLTSWKVGNYGLNVQGANKVICYEPTSLITQVEQGFGRIDRINYKYKDIELILMVNDDYKLHRHFDYQNYYKVYRDLFSTQLPLLPSKNILFTSAMLDDFVEDTEVRLRLFNKLNSNLDNMFRNDDIIIKAGSEGWNFVQSACEEYAIPMEAILPEIRDTEGNITKNKITERFKDYQTTNTQINLFITESKDKGCQGNKVSDLLGSAIYYWKDGSLKIESIGSMFERMENLNIVIADEVESGIEKLKSLSDEELVSYLQDVSNSKDFHPYLKDGIKQKLLRKKLND